MSLELPQILAWDGMDTRQRNAALLRPAAQGVDITSSVTGIITRVREQGDQALLEFGRQFDCPSLQQLEVSPREWKEAEAATGKELSNAIDEAMQRITAFHSAGLPVEIEMETAPGLSCEARYLPITPVGLYIPGGSAPLISTVLMLAIPAAIAGCKEMVMCTPANKQGGVHPAILTAAARCGVKRVFKAGGAQAIAAMGFGTETIPACAKLFGPGNAWVTEAKQQISVLPGGAARDMPAGPSEVLVIADKTADPVAVSWDLLSQAEHGPDSQVLLLSDSQSLLEQVRAKLPQLAAGLPREEILSESLKNLRLIYCDSLSKAIEISNRYAPEHLILNCHGAAELADSVAAAGSVFIGAWTPESLGDYCSGTNHVLPTYGYARAYSGLSTSDFLRRMTLQTATREGLSNTGHVAMTLASAEGLDAHRQAVAYRLETMDLPE
jgi:histidinol dehydrogenase